MISVVITAYNAERFIRDAVRSILGQTHADLECLVIDDGSTDGTLRTVREGVADPRLRVIEAGRIGRGRALNLGLRESRGRYIAIQDADDLSHPRRLEIELMALKQGGAGCGAVGTRGLSLMILAERATTVTAAPGWPALAAPSSTATGGIGDVPLALQDVSGSVVYYNPLAHSSLLLRREALDAVGGYDESRTSQYDYDLLIRLVAAGYRLVLIPTVLHAHRIHPGQFFEQNERPRYVRAAYELQRAARRTLGRSWFLEPVFLGLYGYRLLPLRFRMAWRRVLQNRRLTSTTAMQGGEVIQSKIITAPPPLVERTSAAKSAPPSSTR
jgi:teichuronic acid biosynthesis glycosyltransferase TuaG